MSNSKEALIIFIKNPELGKCKTRLAATIGDEAALQVYKNLLAHTRLVTLESTADKMLFYHEAIVEDDDWSAKDFNKKVQHTGDLGERIADAFQEVLSQYDKAIIIGSDCPEINPKLINIAFDQLNNNDVVIGPTHDGGYYLLGLKKLEQRLFKNIEWSTESVFQSTTDIIENLGLKYAVLEKLSDLDNEEDLNKFPHFKPNA